MFSEYLNCIFKLYRTVVRTYENKKNGGDSLVSATPIGFKRLSADIPEELYKEFAKRCIDKGMKKREYLQEILEKEFEKDK